MGLSVKIYSVSVLILSLLIIFYMLFMLIIIPILPLDEENVLHSFSQTPILVFSAICGLMFCGSLSVFTIFVMGRGKWKRGFESVKAKWK